MGKRSWIVLAIIAAIVIGWWQTGSRGGESSNGAEITSTTTTTERSTRDPHRPDPFAALRGRRGTLPPIKVGDLRLEGQVIDAGKQPVGGARVSLGGDRETVTEGDGSFVFDDLAAGDYAIAAEKTGAYAEENDTTLSETSDPVTLELRRGATLTVRVVAAETGAPLDGAKVATRDRTSVTDTTGIATLRSIDTGYERFEVTAPGRATVAVSVSTDDPETLLERTVELAAGTRASGLVIGPDGKPVPEASVYVKPSIGDTMHWLKSDEHGRWSVDLLPAGKHSIQASSDLYTEAPDALFETDGVHERTDIVVKVEVGATIRGIVVDHLGKPLEDVRASAGGGSGRSDATGRFVINGISEGDHEVSASTDHGSSNSVSVTVARGQSVDVKLVVMPSGLSGIVVDEHGQPVARATICAREKAKDLTRYAVADDYGKFDFGGLETGVYELRATHETSTQRDDEPGAVTAKTGTRNVRLAVAPLGSIKGRLIQDGKPVELFGLVITDDVTSKWADPVVIRSADGRFARADLGPGEWGVILVGPSFEKTTIAKVQLSRGGKVDLGDIVVERGRVVSGRVTDESGAPVAGAVVGITHSSTSEPDDRLFGQALRGAFYTRTDAAGLYSLAGVTPSERTQYIAATHPRAGRTFSTELAPDRTIANLVLARSGTIAGTVLNINDKQSSVIAKRGSDETIDSSAIDHAGNFRFRQLPAGTYTLRLSGDNTLAPISVTVPPNGVVRAEFELPAAPVKVTITGQADCRYVAIEDLSGDQLITGACNNGVGEIDGVSAGHYRVCSDGDCETVHIPAQPTRQAFAVP